MLTVDGVGELGDPTPRDPSRRCMAFLVIVSSRSLFCRRKIFAH